MAKLKVLFACIPTPGNRFMIDLKKGLESQDCEVTWDYEEFWNCSKDFDIIHIHWPEYLSYDLAKYLKTTESIPEEIWKAMQDSLNYWSANSKIVYTRHVQYPHYRHDEEFLNLYRLTVSHAKAIVHFANYSIEQFKSFYPELNSIKHIVIPHQNYNSMPNTISRNEARRSLGISQEAKVMLVFGNVFESEKDIIKKAFHSIEGRNKVLLAPGWKVLRPKISYIRLRELVFKWKKWLAAKKRRFRIDKGFIKEEDAQVYCNAADFLFIPRVNELNSGNITLGFSFGLPTVGVDSKDIGEILSTYNNPVFEKNNDESLHEAIKMASHEKLKEVGANNKMISDKEWDVSIISNKYCKLFKSLQGE